MAEDYLTAISRFEQARKLMPQASGIRLNLAAAYRHAHRPQDALSCLNGVVPASQEKGLFHQTRGQILMDLDRAEQARTDLLEAVRLEMGAETCLALSEVSRMVGDFTEAMNWLNIILNSEPHHPRARMDRSLLALIQGNYQTGWDDFRYRMIQHSKNPALMLTHLPPLRDREVVILGEMGIGDELFFLRWLPHLKQLEPASIQLRLLPGTVDLIGGQIPCVLVKKEEWPPAGRIDPNGQIWLMAADLPLLATASQGPLLPPPLPLKPSGLALVQARQMLENMPRPLVGICSRAGSAPTESLNNVRFLSKSLPLEAMISGFEGFQGTLISFIRDPRESEIRCFAGSGSHLILNQEHSRLDLMSALLVQLDAYMGVSSTYTHILASISDQIPVLTAVPWPPEYRWGLGEESPFFPDMSLFRQKPGEKAKETGNRLKTAVQNWATSSSLI